jgi:hypothetical protein
MSKFIEAINEALEDEVPGEKSPKKRVKWNPEAESYEPAPEQEVTAVGEWEKKLQDPGYLRWKADRLKEFDGIKTISDLNRFCNRYGIRINLDTSEVDQLREAAKRAKEQAQALRVELAKKGDIPLTKVDFEKVEHTIAALRSKIAEAESLSNRYTGQIQAAEARGEAATVADLQERQKEVNVRLAGHKKQLSELEADYQSQQDTVQKASGATTDAGILAKAHQQILAYEKYRRTVESQHVQQAKDFIKNGDENTESPLEVALPRVYFFREGGMPGETADKIAANTPKLNKAQLLEQLNSIKRQMMDNIQRSSTIVELQSALNSFKGPSGEHNISVNFSEYIEAHPGKEDVDSRLKVVALKVYRRWHDEYEAAIKAADDDATHIPEPSIVAQITADGQPRFGHAGRDLMASAAGSTEEQIRTETPARQWMGYFKMNPDDYVVISYGTSHRQLRQIKLRELHERDLTRALPNLELITHPTDQDIAALKTSRPSIQVKDPGELLMHLKREADTFKSEIEGAKSVEDVQGILAKYPDLNIDYTAIAGMRIEPEAVLGKLKTSILKAYKAYLDEYARIVNLTKKTINDAAAGMSDAADKAELRTSILRKTRRPILDAVLAWDDEAQEGEDRPWFDATPGRTSIDFSYVPEDKYGGDDVVFYTEKGRENPAPYNVVNPWPAFSKNPDDPIVVGFTGDDGKQKTGRFTPAEIYKYDLTNRLLNFRVEKIEQPTYTFVSNQPGTSQRWEVNQPWSLYNPLDPSERVIIQYMDPQTKETKQVEGVTRREVWESGILQDARTGAVIAGLFRNPDWRPVRLKSSGAIKYLPPDTFNELWGEARKGNPDVNGMYEFPPNPKAPFDDNGASTVSSVLERGPTTYKDPTKLRPRVNKIGKGVGARYDVSQAHKLEPIEEQYRDTDADFSKRYMQARQQDEQDIPLSAEYSDFADPKTQRMLPWIKDGVLRSPLGDEMPIHWYGPYLVVDLVWRAPGRLERETFPNIPLHRAMQAVKEVWDNHQFTIPSITVPLTKKESITCPVLTDENGLKHVMYPTSHTQVKKMPVSQALKDSQAKIKRLYGHTKREELRSYRRCLQPMRPEDRSFRTVERLDQKNIGGDKCGARAAHDAFPPVVDIQGDEFVLRPGEPVGAEENFGFSMEGLCDRHWVRRFRIISPACLDAMRSELAEIGNYAYQNLGPHKSLIKDQNEVKAYLRNQVTEFIVKWFGEKSFWHMLVDHLMNRAHLDVNNTKRLLFRIQHLYRSMLAMTANLIATRTTFVPKPVEGTSSEMTDEELLKIDAQQLTNFAERPTMKIVDEAQNLIDAGIDKEHEPGTDPEATNLPFFCMAIDQIISYIHNCFLNQEIKASGEFKGERTIIPFAEITAQDVRNTRALKRAWQDRRYPSFMGAQRAGIFRPRR